MQIGPSIIIRLINSTENMLKGVQCIYYIQSEVVLFVSFQYVTHINNSIYPL